MAAVPHLYWANNNPSWQGGDVDELVAILFHNALLLYRIVVAKDHILFNLSWLSLSLGLAFASLVGGCSKPSEMLLGGDDGPVKVVVVCKPPDTAPANSYAYRHNHAAAGVLILHFLPPTS
ncbi:hypothetical protein CCH79_00018129 [Gambusia affinis]|uniref:Uncharacterized protein n=1 Tax=Gambusia affinis TaxID=33528 RepID=A0A315WDI2_GAMAF|nr:hypothetical protein CCH79_00018129 [Gambusia affinis]